MKPLFCMFGIAGAILSAAVSASAAPVNDNFANAIPIVGPIATVTGSNVGASKNFGGEPFLVGGDFGGASVWWTWTATASGHTTIDTMGSDFDTLLGVFTGTVANQLTLVADNNNYNGNTWSQVEFNAVAGTTYRIYVDGLRIGGGFGGRGSQGNITLHVQGVGGITISTPTNGMVFTVGDPIPMSVTIDADFPNPPATRVDFYRGGILFGSSIAAPFSAVASNAPAGSNSFYVVATDSTGMPIQSAIVTVFVQSIGVTLLTPFEDTVFLNTNPITVAAHGYLPAGSITNIEFFVDGQKIGEDSTVPFRAVWSNVVGGSHRFTAVGRSDAGAAYNSQAVNIGVAQILVATNSVWKYLDNGSDQGTAWIAPGFDDSSWASGPAQLGYGDGDEATVVGFGLDASNKFVTTYFRRTFVASDVSSLTNLIIALTYDDAGIVYLNGRELYRAGSLPTNVTYSTLATGQAIEETVDAFTRIATNLLDGTNVLAVEIHQQAGNSSDISFNLQMIGVPVIIHNLSPEVALTRPTNNSSFLAPASLTLEASASDADGTVAKVEYFFDGVKIGEASQSPYAVVWNNPPIGAHALTAVATDDLGARTTSAEVPVVIYDAVGTPVAQIINPLDGAIMEGPTNLLFKATAHALNGVTNVQFLANGAAFGNDSMAPYTAVWPSIFLSNSFVAIVTDANGVRGTSAVVNLFITIPPTNVIAPTVARQVPLAFATVTNLPSITIVFSEQVQNVDAGDLLLNGIPATGVTGGGSNYVFTFPPQAYGEVEVLFKNGHGITDFGYPSNLPFDELGQTAQWEYFLIDRTPPTIAVRTPAASSTVTNLSQISVTFSEMVTNVDASDLLVNGAPAISLSGSGSNYLFNVSQPASGTINITWLTNHGITDLAEVPNAFNGTNANARWSFTLDTRTILIQTNSAWKYIKGLADASAPVDGWRQPVFDDLTWSNGLAPFVFGEPTFTNALTPGTDLGDMTNNAYSSIYLRKQFIVANAGTVTNLLLSHRSDDGFIAWINGIEVFRYNMPAGEIPYNGSALSAATESAGNSGVPYISVTLINAAAALSSGTNILAVHAFNVVTTPASSDFVFNAQLYTYLLDASTSPPRLAQPAPAPGDLFFLTNITVTFSEAVSGVEAADFLVNGLAADTVSSPTNTTYTFSFAQPPYGPVFITWETNHGIADFDDPPRSFDGGAPGSTFRYTLINPSNPRVASQVPVASSTVTGLTSIVVAFTEPVNGVEASDLLVSGTPASSVASADNVSYTFSFTQPPFGAVAIRWATNHGITDQEMPPNGFDPTRFGGQWNYTLIDPAPSATLTSPTNGTFLLPPATVTLRASVTDNDGTVALVAFYEGANKLAESTNTSFSLTLSNLSVGTYVFRAVATDNIGLTGTSAPVVLNVVTSLPIVLVRGPYLQIGTPSSAVLRWRTDRISDAVVFYGTELASLTNIAVQASVTNEHIVQVSGLQADTKYFYSIGSGAYPLVGGTNDGTNYWFKTSPPPGTRRPVRFWALGDSGTAGNGSPDRVNSVKNAFYNYATTNGAADFWLMLGDNAYNSGTDTEYQSAVFNIFPTMLRNKFLWPTLGNHESNQSTTSQVFPYLNIFSLPHNGEAGGVGSGTQKYYSFDYANIHFICLDSMTSGRTTNTAMVRWLQTDLDATAQEWVIAFFHHSLYTKGTHNSDSESDLIELRQNILPILEANGVDIVLMGHSHVYERSYLLDGHYGLSSTLTASMKVDGGNGRVDGSGAYHKNEEGRGVVYTIAGNSGQALGGPLNHPAHFISLNELGSLVIDVSSNRLDAKFLTATGEIHDHYTIFKEKLPAAPIQLLARSLGATDVALTWTDIATNELGYIIERSTDEAYYVRFATNAANATNLIDSGLLANTTYFYRVRAFNDAGESDLSNVASVTTVTAFSPPQAPTGLSVSAGNGSEAYRSQIFLRWSDRSANEAGFLIERSSDGLTFSAVGTVGAGLTRYVDRHLASATPYYYRVHSFNLWGQSSPSNLDGDQTHPQDAFVSAGEIATFDAGVEGTAPIRYQWRFEGVAISGATNEMLAITNAQPDNEGDYTVVITDATGIKVSNPALLFVFAPPLIVEQPASRTNVLGSAAAFRVVANGSAPLYYQWRKNGIKLAGSSGEQLTIAPVTPADQANYDVVVINDLGAITSRVARLVVNTAPVAGADSVQGFRDQGRTVEVAVLLANDFDPDGDLIFITGVGTNSSHGGTVSLSGTQISYSPPAGFSGEDAFTYVLSDAREGATLGVVTVSVSANRAPVLASMPDIVADVLTPLTLSILATDPDVPANQLRYSLSPGAPANATIDPNTGVFNWTPMRAQAPSTNAITVHVVDDGLPPLSNSVSFTVSVNDYIELTAGSTALYAGETNSVPIDIFSSAELTGLECTMQLPAGHLTNLTLEAPAPQLATLAIRTTASNTVVLTFTTAQGQPLQGTQHLARLRFKAIPGQTSSFVPLHITSLTSTLLGTGLTPTPLVIDGRVVVVGSQPLLELAVGNSQRQVIIYGKKGVNYTIQYATNLAPLTTWTFRGTVPMTNIFRTLNLGNTPVPPVFYRLKQ